MVFIREGLITKRLENLEAKLSETISLELTISNKKGFILFACVCVSVFFPSTAEASPD